jgi:hypothetical protein
MHSILQKIETLRWGSRVGSNPQSEGECRPTPGKGVSADVGIEDGGKELETVPRLYQRKGKKISIFIFSGNHVIKFGTARNQQERLTNFSDGC